ncbi:hypothetical protein DM02DRAFT_205214 [Periconia macrospinosa]|uniref:Uncharacterized protein n=1 Tax=Periconia macrospinosa TaxID=97972 RepID=A0A2V1D7I9_9PLEO|nr:hypothetical protein DM02DRAFT_205214 [Periconia macrospinosa]
MLNDSAPPLVSIRPLGPGAAPATHTASSWTCGSSCEALHPPCLTLKSIKCDHRPQTCTPMCCHFSDSSFTPDRSCGHGGSCLDASPSLSVYHEPLFITFIMSPSTICYSASPFIMCLC